MHTSEKALWLDIHHALIFLEDIFVTILTSVASFLLETLTN